MGLAVDPLSPALGAEITGALLARPAAEASVAVLRRALLDHLVVVVRDRPRHHLRDRPRKAEVPIVYRPGRHPPSGSFFLHFLDPDGMTLEYSRGMEEFPEEGARKPRMFEPARNRSTSGAVSPRAGWRRARSRKCDVHGVGKGMAVQ